MVALTSHKNDHTIIICIFVPEHQVAVFATTTHSGRSVGLVDRQETLQMKSKDNLLNDSSQLAGPKSDMLRGIFSVDLRGIELGGGIFLAPRCGDDSFC